MYTNFFTILTVLASVASALPADGENTRQLYRRDPSDQSGNSRFIYQVYKFDSKNRSRPTILETWC